MRLGVNRKQLDMIRGKLYILTGPSAVGKTSISVRLARELGAEILSCDSLLVYRGMNIGTAKPSVAEMGGISHHGFDLVEPSRQYSVGDYVRMAKNAVADIERRGKAVLVVGGSGFYLKSFFAPVVDEIAVCQGVREQIRDLDADRGLEGVLARLAALNPEGFGDLDTKNSRRVARALERCVTSGRSLGELAKAFAEREEPYGNYKKQCVCLTRDRDDLRQRVADRTKGMFSAGLVEEVSSLLKADFETNPSAAGAIGYREALSYIKGRISREEMEAAINQNTMALIKKQETWFRKQIPIDSRVKLAVGDSDTPKNFSWQQER